MFTNKIPWIILLLLWMGGATWWHVCKIKQLCDGTMMTATQPTSPSLMPPLRITDGNRLNLNVAGNFSFAKSGTVANEAEVGNILQTLADYLKANPSRMLTVTGYYYADEHGPGQEVNPGLARAEYINIKLIALGVSATQLAAKSGLAGTLNPMPYNARRDSLYGGLAFVFGEKKMLAVDSTAADTTLLTVEEAPDKKADEVAKTEEESKSESSKTEMALAKAQKFTSVFEPIDLYFEYAKPDYIETEDTRKFFDEARMYLKTHKGKQLVLIGYTDSEGSDYDNVLLSRERANAVKKKLVEAGADSDRIRVVAKGEGSPKASNDTEEGRKANRRVSAVVK